MTKGLICLLALALPLGALAQGTDADYCNALVQKYERYIVKLDGRKTNLGSVEGSVAVEQCRAGNPSGIPVLERRLRDSKIDLPSRG